MKLPTPHPLINPHQQGFAARWVPLILAFAAGVLAHSSLSSPTQIQHPETQYERH